MAVYGPPQAVASLWKSRATNHQSGSIGMPYFNWEALKNHVQYAVIEVEDGGNW